MYVTHADAQTQTYSFSLFPVISQDWSVLCSGFPMYIHNILTSLMTTLELGTALGESLVESVSGVREFDAIYMEMWREG